ncbi:MAG: hypothetical protein AAGC73_01825 [Verrucomicrobiota bacterium]
MDSELDDHVPALVQFFEGLSASPEQAEIMARQLLKRASQIAEIEGISKVEATEKLLNKVIQARQGD